MISISPRLEHISHLGSDGDGAEGGGDLWRMRGNSTPLALYPTPARPADTDKYSRYGLVRWAVVGGYFIYPVPLHVLHTEWRVIKKWEGEGNASVEGAISHSDPHPQKESLRVGESSLLVAFLDLESKGFIIGNFCGEWNSDNMAMDGGERGEGRNE